MSKSKGFMKPDERIEKASNAMQGKMFWLMTVLLLVSLVVKIVCRVPWGLYALEVLAFVTSGVFCLVQEIRKGILFSGRKDEVLIALHDKIFATAFMIELCIFVFGELIVSKAVNGYLGWKLFYFVVWGIPALIYSVNAIANGWIIWGGKKREQAGKKRLVLSSILGAAIVGLWNGIPRLYHDGVFHLSGIWWILGLGAAFGIAYYIVMGSFIKASEKQADIDVMLAERKSAEQEGELNEE